MELSTTDNPAAPVEQPEPAKETELTETEQPEIEAEADEEGQAAEPEYEEVDYNGNRYKVPKEVAPALMMQADYTRKTQEVAEERRAVQAERESFEAERRINEEIFDDVAQFRAIDARINELQSINPHSLPPQEQNRYMIELMQLQQSKTDLGGRINYRKSELAAIQERASTAELRQAVSELSKPDERLGWSGKYDEPTRTSLAAAAREIGIPDPVLNSIREPVLIKALHLAKIGLDTLKKQQKAVSAKPAQPEAKPVPTLGTAKAKGVVDPDKLPMDQWVKYEQQRMAKARGR